MDIKKFCKENRMNPCEDCVHSILDNPDLEDEGCIECQKEGYIYFEEE